MTQASPVSRVDSRSAQELLGDIHLVAEECPARVEQLLRQLGRMRDGESWSYRTVDAAMKELEALTRQHADLALRLMVFLYDLADDALASDICDGIEFWISESGDQALAQFIERRRRCFPARPSSVAALTWLQWLQPSDSSAHGGARGD